MSNNTQPEIRFPGFMEDWEERKLNELAEFNPKSDLPERFEYVDLESVVGTELVRHRTENRYSAPSRAQRLAKKNDVFYQTVRPYQKNNYLFDLPYDNYVFSTGYAQMRPIGNGYFLLTLIQEEKFVNRVLERSTGTSYPAINSNDLAKLPVKVPADIQEQQKVGTFFKQIDNTITLHQRKLDLLKETKKGFLQKMFPKNGAKVPEIRFPGFTEDWEQRKLSELAEVKTGFPFKNDDFIDGGDYLVITNGNIQNNSALVDGNIGNRISAVSDEIKDKYLLNYGDILVTMDGTVGRTAKVFEKNQILAQRVGRLVANTTPEFLYQWLNTGKFFGDMTKVSHGGTIKHISLSEISDFNAFVPVNEDERVKIGSLLLNIDKTITLHQRKLDLLKETKKGFLQKMFV